jgi:hypothetical protein
MGQAPVKERRSSWSRYYKKTLALVYNIGPTAWSKAFEALASGWLGKDGVSLKRGKFWDRCYDQNFLRFSPILCEKMAFFSICRIQQCYASKNAKFFAEFFGENIFKKS